MTQHRPWLAVVALVACSSSTAAPVAPPDDAGATECTPPATGDCTCQSGRPGVAECGPDGMFGPCNCSSTSTPDSTAPKSDGGCAKVGRYYVDADGDGFGAGPQVDVCEPAGPGYSTVTGDCDDEDARAFPSQSEAQEVALKGVGGHDFNCDGKAVPKWDAVTTCNPTRTGCTWNGQQGWQDREAKCGETKTWVKFCSGGGGFVCNRDTEQRAQKCL